MKLSNYHNEGCYELLAPIVNKFKEYDFDKIQKEIYDAFSAPKNMDVKMWYTLILKKDKKKLFFGFTQELNKPKIGSKLKYENYKFEVIKIGLDNGFHGWCRLIIVEVK